MIKFLLIPLFAFTSLFAKDKLLVLYPEADLSNTARLNVSDVNAIHILFADGFEYYSKMNIIVPSDKTVCYSSECAISLASEYSSQKVVTSKIRVLGSKIIFTGMIQNVDGSDQFTTRITALNVEDMENASMRLAKSLLSRDSIDDVADIDNIIEDEEAESARRKSIYRIGGSLGYVVPFGGENYYFYDGDIRKWNATPFFFGYTQNWETKSNSTMILDAFVSTNKFGFDLTYNHFKNRTDNSLFYGYGLGWHAGFQYSDPVFDDWGDTYDYETTLRHGPALLGQIGYIFMRTYNVNVLIRAKYHFQFSTLEGNYDNGISFGVTLTKKFTSSGQSIRGRSERKTVNRYPLLEILLKNL
tara:strand:+ start:727 stop:1800 length:1074 start_codon:yes stop_codon:yes gene_type:complete